MTWLASPLVKLLAGLGIVAALYGAGYLSGRQDGRDALLARLAADKAHIVKDGKEIDHEVLGADDDALCRLLGGCGLPDGSSRD